MSAASKAETKTGPANPASAPAKLVTGSIPRHLVTQTLPMIVGVAAIMSIGLVDAYFVGQLGPDALAAISFIFPISVALTSLGVGLMVGINSVVARALGEGDTHKAARRANFGIGFACAAGLVMGLGLFALLDPVFALMNAGPDTLPLIRTYMQPFAMGFPLLIGIMGFNGVLRGQGEAQKTSLVSITYAATNWVLDPILITGALGFEGLGIIGAAYATVAGWVCGVAVAVMLVMKSAIPLDPSLIFKGRVLDPARAILRVGLPAAFSNAINPFGLAVLTALVALESEAAVAGFGAAGRLQSFATVPLLGLSASIGAIVGQNWGAREYGRAREAAMLAGGFCIAWGLFVAVGMITAGDWFADLFTDDPPVIAEFKTYLRIAAWGYAGFGLLIVGNGIMNAIDKAGYALVQSIGRVFVVMLPVAWLFQDRWGSEAVYAAELAANAFGAASAIGLVWYLFERRTTRQGKC